MASCALCLKENKLELSHIIPKFASRWLKATSATGYFRGAEKPNLRKQDGEKEYLLCGACEDIFEKNETPFANKIFHPYVQDGLDENGSGTGAIAKFAYEDWLLRLAISIHWRVLVARGIGSLPLGFHPQFEKLQEVWRQFLLGQRGDTGECETHILFLQSFRGAVGPPGLLHKKTNFYILRTVDATPIFSSKMAGVYSKLGPIALFTSVVPSRTDYKQTRIGMRGTIDVKQHLRNKRLITYICKIRPKEALSSELSENQKNIVAQTMLRDPEKTMSSLTFKAYEADLMLGEAG